MGRCREQDERCQDDALLVEVLVPLLAKPEEAASQNDQSQSTEASHGF